MNCRNCNGNSFVDNKCEYCGTTAVEKLTENHYIPERKKMKCDGNILSLLKDTHLIGDGNIIGTAINCEIVGDGNIIQKCKNTEVIGDGNIY